MYNTSEAVVYEYCEYKLVPASLPPSLPPSLVIASLVYARPRKSVQPTLKHASGCDMYENEKEQNHMQNVFFKCTKKWSL